MHLAVIVVTLAHNLPLLRECLDAVSKQTLKPSQIIVVADGITEHQKNELMRLCTSLNAKLDWSSTRRGMAQARNIGIQHAKTRIVAFVDDDGVAQEDWAEQLVKCHRRTGVAAVAGRVVNRTSSAPKVGELFNDRLQPKTAAETCHLLIGCNMSFVRAILYKVGLFDTSIDYGLDETELASRLIKNGYRIASCSQAVVKHDFARNWRNLLWKTFKQGEKAMAFGLSGGSLAPPTSKIKFLFLAIRKTKRVRTLFQLLLLYIIRRIGTIISRYRKLTQ